MSEKLLEISGLSVCYEGEQILNNICFSVEKGETVGIAGESGSGKSTLLRAILRLMGKNGSITGGQITFRGEELTGMSEKKLRSLCGSEIGMISRIQGHHSVRPGKSEHRSVKACAPMRNAADSSPRFLGECLAEKAAEKSKI